MGEAKARGTFEQRKAAAQERNQTAQIERLQRLAEIERNKTPEQKLRDRDAEMTMAQILGLAAPYMITHKR